MPPRKTPGKPKRKRHKRKVGRACGKRRYRDLVEAKDVLHYAKANPDPMRPIPVRAYACELCGGAHLTSQP